MKRRKEPLDLERKIFCNETVSDAGKLYFYIGLAIGATGILDTCSEAKNISPPSMKLGLEYICSASTFIMLFGISTYKYGQQRMQKIRKDYFKDTLFPDYFINNEDLK